MYRLRPLLTAPPKFPAARTAEFAPSLAITRSYEARNVASGGAGVRKCTGTPTSAQRCCRIASSSLRLIAENPWPPEVVTVPRKWTSMSSHRAVCRCIAANTAGSACSMPPSVSSENTTPKPNVSSAALRSHTVTSRPGSSCFANAAKYSPPGPPPTTAIRMCLPSPSLVGSCLWCSSAIAEHEALELAGAGTRQLGQEPDDPRVLVGSDHLLGEVLQRQRVGGRAAAKHH